MLPAELTLQITSFLIENDPKTFKQEYWDVINKKIMDLDREGNMVVLVGKGGKEILAFTAFHKELDHRLYVDHTVVSKKYPNCGLLKAMLKEVVQVRPEFTELVFMRLGKYPNRPLKVYKISSWLK